MLVTVAAAQTLIAEPDAWPPKPIRIGSRVSGHIHPATCVTKKGTILVTYCRVEAHEMLLSRSTDSGHTWSTPAEFPHIGKNGIYPGSLTTLSDGRVVHAWNRWYMNEKGVKSRYIEFSISADDGKTWSEPKSLAKNPDKESVIRHPFVELPDGTWLFSLTDRTVVYDPKKETESPFADGRNHGLVPIVRTAKGTLVSGIGQRSTDGGKKWEKVSPFPSIGANGWRFDMVTLENGWLVASEVLGPGVGGDKWRFVISRDDGKSWDIDGAIEFYNPGRPIGGRACPRTVQIDKETIGTVLYDTDEKQEGGAGVFFLRMKLQSLKK